MSRRLVHKRDAQLQQSLADQQPPPPARPATTAAAARELRHDPPPVRHVTVADAQDLHDAPLHVPEPRASQPAVPGEAQVRHGRQLRRGFAAAAQEDVPGRGGARLLAPALAVHVRQPRLGHVRGPHYAKAVCVEAVLLQLVVLLLLGVRLAHQSVGGNGRWRRRWSDGRRQGSSQHKHKQQ